MCYNSDMMSTRQKRGRPARPARTALGRELRRQRVARGWSQEDLAEAIGASQAMVSNWELGRHVPDLGHLASLANVYGMDMLNFLTFFQRWPRSRGKKRPKPL